MVVYVNVTSQTLQPRGLRNIVPPAFDAVVSVVQKLCVTTVPQSHAGSKQK